MGDVVFVDLPEVGKQVSKGETFGVVESVKAVSDMYSPITGEVVEVNSQLLESPALVSESSIILWIEKRGHTLSDETDCGKAVRYCADWK